MKNFLLTLIVVLSVDIRDVIAEIHHFRYENIIGTSLELQIESKHITTACQIKDTAVLEISRLEKILSSYHSDSEFNRWQRGEVASTALSSELSTVLKRAEYWRKRTYGAFDLRVEHLHKLWNRAEHSGNFPTAAQRHSLIANFTEAPYQWNSTGIVLTDPGIRMNLNALAKGFILDKVCELISAKYSSTNNFLINIGGDLRKLGSSSWNVGVENPFAPYEGENTFSELRLAKPMAVATSGSYRRGFTIENTLHSHIIDPRTGLPTSQIRSATVLAATAMDADALATSFSVLPVQQTIELTESIKNVECLLILANGRAVASSGWPGFRLAKHQLSNVDSMEPDTKTGLRISFSLNRPQEGRYRRPYVAIWLEDGDGFPVKTALLWLQVEQPGPRWHRDLTRWYRNDRARKLVESADLIKTVAGATRGPGKYETRFDGNDNSGKPLASGRYTLCIEVAREHGTYQIIRKSIMLGPKAIPLTKISGNVEVGGISYQYTPPSSKAN